MQRLQDAAIRLFTRSPYSHVEAIPGFAVPGTTNTCISASWRDGGVRTKEIHLRTDAWDFLVLPDDPKLLLELAKIHDGMKYDVLGILLSQILPLKTHSSRRWFCSEFCAQAVGLGQPQTYSPGSLYNYFCGALRCKANSKGSHR